MKRPQAAGNRQLEALFDRIFYCPSCTTWRLARSLAKSRPQTASRRYQTTWSSTTAINGVQPMPPQFKPLHEALIDVRKKAGAYVNLSRLQLAIQGVESLHPTTRVAILGLNSPDTARRVTRLLLADVLENEGEWEQQLIGGSQDFSRGLVIRYGRGENTNLPKPRNSVPVLHVPSNFLHEHNVEFLVSSVNADESGFLVASQVETPSETFLSPAIGTPTSESGRQVTISQPVHACLVVAEGLDQLVVVSQILSSIKPSSTGDRELIQVAVNLQTAVLNSQTRHPTTLATNVKKAEEALAALRESVTHASEYGHKWNDSGLSTVSEWLKDTAGNQPHLIEPLAPVSVLIQILLASASSNIQAAAVESLKNTTTRGLSSATLVNLEEAIDQFSRSSHQELQSGLASAWKSRNWRKLAWYKLFWRVDDVGLIIADLVGNAWLPKTERAVYELSGRLVQVGIKPVTETPTPQPIEPGQAFESAPVQEVSVLQPDAQLATASIEAQPTQAVIINTSGSSAIQVQPIPQPIPIASSISRARNVYMTDAITSLTTTAQQLVLRTLTITGLSAGLSGLTYFSLFSSIYEAGTIAAVGTVFALWRMQTDWQKSTKQLEDNLYDEGRRAIVDVVDRMKVLVDQRSQGEEDPVEKQLRLQAEEAVAKATAALDALEKDPWNNQVERG